MRKLRRLEIAKVGRWGQDGAKIDKQDLADVVETFQGKRPIVVGHDGAQNDKAPKFGDVLDVQLNGDGTVLIGDVVFLDAAESLFSDGYYDGWSVSIPTRGSDGKRYLHHLAILGATPPKIPGLKELAIDYADGDSARIIGFSGKIPEEVEELDAKEIQDKFADLEKKVTTLQEENAALKAGKTTEGEGGEGKKKDEGAAKDQYADELKKLKDDAAKSRMDAFKKSVTGKVPAGMLAKAVAIAGMINEITESEFSDGDKKRSERPIGVLAELLEAWPSSVSEGPSGNNYSDSVGADGKPIDWNKLAQKV